MALTIRQVTDEEIQQAKELTGKGAASAAIVACVTLAGDYKRRYESQLKENQELRDRLRHLDQVQSRLAACCDEALTIIRQRELL